MKWCCLGFEAHYHVAGQRGSAILVDRVGDGRVVFTLQFRSVDNGLQLPYTEIPVTLCEDNQIQYCPWCGKQLASWYERDIDLLIRPGFRIFIPELDSRP
jgi:hypothetical protein